MIRVALESGFNSGGFKNLKLTPKIVGSIVVTLLVAWAVGFYVTQRRINAQTDAAFVDKVRQVDGMAAQTLEYFSEHVEVYAPHHQFKQLSQIPVVTAWSVARKYAESQGMKFATPSLHPRDPHDQPDDFEADALHAFEQQPTMKEYYRRQIVNGRAVMRYAQPVRLTEDCLFCHGSPAGSRDPFNYKKEGLKVGDLRAAFVVTAPMDAIVRESRANALASFLVDFCSLLAVGIAVFFVVQRVVVRPVRDSAALAKEIAENNLAAPDIAVDSGDEVGEAVAALNLMKNNLHGIMENIAANAEQIASAGHELASSAAQQSAASNAQTDRTIHVANAMHEMSTTVTQVSDSANQAAHAASKALEAAHAGGKVVGDSVAAMRSIKASVSSTTARVQELGKKSSQIGEIVAVIQDIADQTNLLALNAAIEAARAGEQGRGFAVVADEVRKLAERTSRATLEIANNVQSIQSETKMVVQAMETGQAQVGEGAKAAERTGESLQEIIRMSDRVRDMINQIAVTTAEQSATSTEVSRNVNEIARLAQESCIGSTEAAKACDEVSALALELEKIVRQFTLRTPKHSAGAELDAGSHAGDDSTAPLLYDDSLAAKPLGRGASA